MECYRTPKQGNIALQSNSISVNPVLRTPPTRLKSRPRPGMSAFPVPLREPVPTAAALSQLGLPDGEYVVRLERPDSDQFCEISPIYSTI